MLALEKDEAFTSHANCKKNNYKTKSFETEYVYLKMFEIYLENISYGFPSSKNLKHMQIILH